jgi:2-dehydropantoate 2-reductase
MTKILTIGAGAVGCLYSAMLSLSAQVEVSLVGRSNFAEIKKEGVEINSIWQNFNFKPKEILQNASDFKREADFLIVATKSLPSLNLPKLIAGAVSEKTTIILIQNGIFIEEEIARAFSKNHLLSVIAFVDVVKISANLIKHAGEGNLTIGEFQNANKEKTALFQNLLSEVGVPNNLSENILFERFKKLLWNASFNPISVLFGQLNTKEILDDLALKNLVKKSMLEVSNLAASCGFEISENLIDEIILKTHARKNPALTSMLLDFKAGREMEIQAILGNALEFAQKQNVQMPLIKALQQQLKNV